MKNQNRNFEAWLLTMKDSIATWTYYTDFPKAYGNTQKIKVELNILNSLIGSQNIKEEFLQLLNDYPNILKVIPILLAKREEEIKVNDSEKTYFFNLKKKNYTNEEYALFMEKSGLFNLLQNQVIKSLVDYVLGVEVGMDTNSRKNRTGHAMEDLVESYLKKAGLIKNKTYFKEMYKSEVEQKFGLDLSGISNNDKTEERFDFVFVGAMKEVYAVEVNFYSGGGSKLNETARSYKTLALEAQNIPGFKFVWFTDGIGWNSARHNLEETFDVLDTLFNINDLEHGIVDRLVKTDEYLHSILKSY